MGVGIVRHSPGPGRLLRIAAPLLGFVLALGSIVTAGAARAQFVPELQNGMLDIRYDRPDNQNYESTYRYVERRKVLEELSQLLAPLRLPRRLLVKTAQCDVTNAWYNPRSATVTICYEWIAYVVRAAPSDTSPDGFTREQAIIGPVIQVILHEMSHAIFDLLDVPLLGREEDAADQLAAFIMLQFGSDFAKQTMSGAAYFFKTWASERKRSFTDFADEHGTDAQRFYNYLCIAYGGDPATFKGFVEKGLLPQARAANCKREYELIRSAFVQTILPHVDVALMKKVQETKWLLPGDGR